MAALQAQEKRAETNGAGDGAGAISPQIGKWLRTQSLAAIVLAIMLIPVGSIAVYSSLFGSLAAFVPALFFAAFAGRRIGTDSAAFLQAAVIGEAIKLLLTALICMAVFLWVEPLAAGWFFTGMIVVLLAGWIGLFSGLKIDE